ncbi:MAG: hypothetical protein WB502_13210 [Thermoactinomyces sp.]
MGCHCKKKIVCVVTRRRRRRRSCSARARINNGPTTGAQSAGLVNLNVQVPINLGDATAVCGGRGNSISNLL